MREGQQGHRDGLAFAKGHGTGNDFVLLPDRDGVLDLTAADVARLCDRRTGLGADGVLRVTPGPDGRWFMDYRNADGSIAEMCGNGIRVFTRWLVDEGWAEPGRLEVLTRAGVKVVDTPKEGDPCADMGPPQPITGDWVRPSLVLPVGGVATTLAMTPLDMGNPHLVGFVDDVATVGWDDVPLDVNVEVVQRIGPGHVRMRVHERGVGETQSCGTGACAVAVVALDQQPGVCTVDVPGGRLTVTWTGETVLLSGPAVIVAEGVLR